MFEDKCLSDESILIYPKGEFIIHEECPVLKMNVRRLKEMYEGMR